jgi:hypothetical protein
MALVITFEPRQERTPFGVAGRATAIRFHIDDVTFYPKRVS